MAAGFRVISTERDGRHRKEHTLIATQDHESLGEALKLANAELLGRLIERVEYIGDLIRQNQDNK